MANTSSKRESELNRDSFQGANGKKTNDLPWKGALSVPARQKDLESLEFIKQ